MTLPIADLTVAGDESSNVADELPQLIWKTEHFLAITSLGVLI